MQRLILMISSFVGVSASILNWAEIPAGIWLIILGKWQIVSLGILVFFVSPHLISSCSIPAIFITKMINPAENKSFYRSIAASIFNNLYHSLIATVWIVNVMFICVNTHQGLIFWLSLIWGYGNAMFPWAFLASYEQNTSALNTFIASILICTLSLMVGIILGANITTGGLIVSIGMLIFIVYQSFVNIQECILANQSRYLKTPHRQGVINR